MTKDRVGNDVRDCLVTDVTQYEYIKTHDECTILVRHVYNNLTPNTPIQGQGQDRGEELDITI